VRELAAGMAELAAALSAKDEAARVNVADKVTDLFVAQATMFTERHVALFDQIIAMLADAIEARARARLSEKLADVPNAPPEVIRKFAKDDITVARPVLARSPRLTDADLIAAARSGGRDHMLAISERRDLGESVTDVLVAEGDRVVLNAVASNPTARFSDKSYDDLVSRSRVDELLHAAIARRRDIPPRHMAVLFELAKKAARERLQGELAGAGRKAVKEAVEVSARDIAAETLVLSETYKAVMAEVGTLMDGGALNEEAIVGFARREQAAHAVCGIALLGRVPLALAERAVSGGDHDLLVIIARSLSFGWPAVRSLLVMIRDQRPGPRALEKLEDSFGRLTQPTAEKLLRYILARQHVDGKR
jgi:uncharacterized protein (DUF2336 family)